MKWMWSTAFVVVAAVSATASAQSGKDMNDSKMADAMRVSYTGCVTAVNHGGWFLLTNVADDHQAMMHSQAMMKADADMAMKEEPTAANDMHGDHMVPSAVALTGRSDLKKHVGQKVAVSGVLSHGMSDAASNSRDSLKIASLKVIAKSCS